VKLEIDVGFPLTCALLVSLLFLFLFVLVDIIMDQRRSQKYTLREGEERGCGCVTHEQLKNKEDPEMYR